MISIELKLMKSRKLIIPAITLLLAMLFLSIVDCWFGSVQKQLKGEKLAEFISIRTFQSTLPALFFLFWMLQFSIHLINTGFYKMLLVLGWSRTRLYLYCLFQLSIYAAILLLFNFLCHSILIFFFNSNPIQLFLYTDFNALISQYLYLLIIGIIGITIGFLRPNYAMILPVFIYWLLEGWAYNFIHKKLELGIGEFLPLQAIKQ